MAILGIRTIQVDKDLLDRTLACYFPHVRYLRSARIEFSDQHEPFETELGSCVAIGRGDFTGRPAWYIRNTGHFNAIEFNICYNQLAFVLLAQCIKSHAIPALSAHLPEHEFFARMLPDLVIHRYSVTFERPMLAPEFRASVGILKVVNKMGRLFLQTQCRVAPPEGPWCSRGDVTLAVLRSDAPVSLAIRRCGRNSRDAVSDTSAP
jgi:hypothetical protein